MGANAVQAVDSLISRYPDLAPIQTEIFAAYDALRMCFESGGKLLVCGNGGSSSDSDHIVGELMKGFMYKRPVPQADRQMLSDLYGDEGNQVADFLQGSLPAIGLSSHTALTSAVANDTDASMIYAQQVYGYGKPGDVLFGISTSGNSLNVIRAIEVAKLKGLVTIGLTGQSGGRMKSLCDVSICVPYTSTPDVQERHLPIYHALCIAIEEAMFTS